MVTATPGPPGAAGGDASGAPLIRVDRLTKVYATRRGEKLVALDHLSFDVADGQFVCVVGPSGCGKSTLLSIVGGLIPRTSGEVLLGGSPVMGPRRDVGVVFQEAVLLPWRTVLQNALLPVQVHGLDPDTYVPRAARLLEQVGLGGFEDRYPYELSGGMQQRNSIVRALVHDPAMLLMDEPFGALDAMTREQMNLLIQRVWLAARKTVIFITHSIPEAIFLGDRVLVMSPRPGRLVEDVSIDLPRPRDLDVMTSAAFGEYVRLIRHQLDAQTSVL